MAFTVTVGGTTVDGLFEVNYSGADTDKLGTAEVQVKNSASNRAFEFGDEVIIQRDGETVWTGYLEKKPPTGSRNLKLNLTARDKREELQFVEVHRPWYNRDSGEVVEEMVNTQVQPRSPVVVHTGDDLDGWSSDVPVFELADLPSVEFNEYGSDLLFLYWGEGESGTFSVTYDDVPFSAVDDAEILWFETRYAFNNEGGFFSAEVELTDDSGTSMVWDLPVPDGVEFTKQRLPLEEATTDGAELSGSLELEYRISLSGSLPEARAGVIDYARTRPFGTRSRDTGLSTVDVQDSGREITRRFDASVFEAIAQLAVEDGATSFVDEDDHLHYEPDGDTDAPESISYSSTRVVDIEPNRDATDITNKVVVQGAGDLQVPLKSSASISFYGVAARERPLVNKEIQNEGELRDYGEGYLSEEAWEDTDVTFTVADPAFKNVRVGQSLFVDWPPEDLNGYFTVSEVRTDTAGRVEVGVTGSSA
jgi:hypothetical protein